jgi:hypothetical protein
VIIRLECPLCGALVSEGSRAPAPGRCPGCEARFASDAERPEVAVAALLAKLGLDDVPAERLTRRLFELPSHHALAGQAEVTSDRREGFYRWWAFAREDGPDAQGPLRRLFSA